MLRPAVIAFVSSVCAGLGLLLGVVLVVPLASRIEAEQMPPQVDWRPTEWHVVDGRDVYVTGLVRYVRHCTYIPPPGARDENGQNYMIESRAQAAGKQWDVDERPQKFGPWIVYGGAGRQLTFYTTFKCHPMWETVVELGTLDTREKK
jgi:hypothetical protein